MSSPLSSLYGLQAADTSDPANAATTPVAVPAVQLPITYTIVTTLGAVAAIGVFFVDTLTKRESEELGLIMAIAGAVAVFIALGNINEYWWLAAIGAGVALIGLLTFHRARTHKRPYVGHGQGHDIHGSPADMGE